MLKINVKYIFKVLKVRLKHMFLKFNLKAMLFKNKYKTCFFLKSVETDILKIHFQKCFQICLKQDLKNQFKIYVYRY